MRGLVTWLYDRDQALHLPLPKPLHEAVAAIYEGQVEPTRLERAFLEHRPELLASLDAAARATPRPEPVATNLELLTLQFGLRQSAWTVMGVIACFQRFDMVHNL